MILALSAFKGSGKDTLADYLVQRHDFVRVAFADPLKDQVAEMFSIPRDTLDDPNFKESPLLNFPVKPQDDYSKMIANFMVKEFRSREGKTSQVFFASSGEGIVQDANGRPQYETLYWTPRALAILIGSTMRSTDSSHWVKQAIKKIHEQNKNVVITDLRYKSEINQLKEEFGDKVVTVRISRYESSPSSDPSELDLLDFKHDYDLDNKGSREDFFEKAEFLINQI